MFGDSFNKYHIIVDLQFGSTGKGLLAGYLAEKIEPDCVVAAWAPNAGHTYIDRHGRKMVNIALPNGIVCHKVRNVLIGPGSTIDTDRLDHELGIYQDLMVGKRLVIHQNAMVVGERHREAERSYGFSIGSTMKGVGEAAISKIRRKRHPVLGLSTAVHALPDHLRKYLVTHDEYCEILDKSRRVIVEGAQGYSLGINSGFYPYVTSRECTVPQIMSDCAIPMVSHKTIYGCARTFPIRVANRYDENGRMIGTSGPCYPDQQELKWSDIGIEPELTTVTKLPRRIFTFSMDQMKQACRANGVDFVFLNFCNYMDETAVESMIKDIEEQAMNVNSGGYVKYTGHGPDALSIKERR